MPQVQLPEKVFEAAQRLASVGGFACVDEYFVEIVRQQMEDPLDNPQAFLTPARLAHIDKAIEQADSGNVMSMEQLDTAQDWPNKLIDEL